MSALADARVTELAALGICGYVTKKDSPSCGLECVPVWPERGGAPQREGTGAFVQAIVQRLPLLPVQDEAGLHQRGVRDGFIERIFAYRRWQALCDAGLSRGALADFHARHELAILSHSPDAYRRLGWIVETVKGRPLAAAVEEYGTLFMAALSTHTTRSLHVGALQRMAARFEGAPAEDRAELEEAIAEFSRGRVPLVVPLTVFRSQARRHGIEVLARQTYLHPEPAELMVRSQL
jgi:uncharacterized protein YbgA (DUF1722 family)